MASRGRYRKGFSLRNPSYLTLVNPGKAKPKAKPKSKAKSKAKRAAKSIVDPYGGHWGKPQKVGRVLVYGTPTSTAKRIPVGGFTGTVFPVKRAKSVGAKVGPFQRHHKGAKTAKPMERGRGVPGYHWVEGTARTSGEGHWRLVKNTSRKGTTMKRRARKHTKKAQRNPARKLAMRPRRRRNRRTARRTALHTVRRTRKSFVANRKTRKGHKKATKRSRKSRKGRKGRRHNKGRKMSADASQLLKQALAGLCGFLGARFVGNQMANIPGVPVAAVPYMPLLGTVGAAVGAYYACKKIKALQPYKGPVVIGAGIAALDLVMKMVLPAEVRAFVDAPAVPALAGSPFGISPFLMGETGRGRSMSVMGEYVPERLGEYVVDDGDGMGEYLASPNLDAGVIDDGLFGNPADALSVDVID
jgi:hypothetical protein